MSVTGGGREPMKAGVALCDVLTGMYATVAVLAALRHAERTGEGQHIDIALLDVQVASLANQALNYLTTERNPRRWGNAHPNIVPYQPSPRPTGIVIVAVGNDAQFRRFCEVAGRPDLAADPRCRTNAGRVEGRADADRRSSPSCCLARPSSFWLQALEAVGVPCGPINDSTQVFADRHVQARGLSLSLEHPTAGVCRRWRARSGYRRPRSPTARPRRRSGPDTVEVLRERLALAEAELARLRGSGTI